MKLLFYNLKDLNLNLFFNYLGGNAKNLRLLGNLIEEE